jgi:5-methylcytosine-specific restriction endonuclease McrA
MTRSTPEWVSTHDDQKVPPRVRQRVFDAHGGICHLTGRQIAPGEAWELEHVHALILGGQHRESNMAPALKEAHKAKTAMEMGVKAKIARVRQKHIGVKKSKASLTHDKFKRLMDGTVVDRRTGEIVSGGRQP